MIIFLAQTNAGDSDELWNQVSGLVMVTLCGGVLAVGALIASAILIVWLIRRK